jgi:ATP-dependent RNA helicase RhlE
MTTTVTPPPLPITHAKALFSDLPMGEPLQRALADKNYTEPSPIQAQAIPHLLQGRDMIGIAQTGTGKTAAFALPILKRLSEQPRPLTPKRPRALILAPTRELAVQIGDSFAAYGKYLKLSHLTVFGGVNISPQIRALARGVDVLIATPGRLADLERQRCVSFDAVEVFVLDEADRMLDLGFVHEIKRIIAKLPPRRQSLLF